MTIHEDAGASQDRRRRTELMGAMEAAVGWYHERLLSAPDAGRARDYLRSRGYDGAVVRQFRLGWAPDDWDALAQGLGLSERLLTGTGLGFVNRRGRPQDAFRARIIFPICDPSGRPVALGGRILPGRRRPGDPGRAPEPKYKNSQETAIYVKRRTLYALNWAKDDVIKSGEVVVCEGYTDVIGCFLAGVPRAVATCGTALAEEHFTLLRNFARRIVLAYDADSAGQSATQRVYEWERRHEVDVAVAALPAGADPGDLAGRDPDALRQAIAEARPFLQFRVDRVLGAADLTTAEGRARAAEAAIEAVAEHPDDLVRDQYVMQIADRCRVEAERLRPRVEEARRRLAAVPRGDGGDRPSRDRPSRDRPSRTRPDRTDRSADRADDGGRDVVDRRDGPSGDGSNGPTMDVEDPGAGPSGGPAGRPRPVDAGAGRPGLEALRLAVHRPEAVEGRLEEMLFDDPVQRRAFSALLAAESLHEAVESAPPESAELLRRLAVEEPVWAGDSLADPVDAVVSQLLRAAVRRQLVDLQAEARTGGGPLGDVAAETARVRLWLEELDDSATGRDAGDRLLAWLLERGREGA